MLRDRKIYLVFFIFILMHIISYSLPLYEKPKEITFSVIGDKNNKTSLWLNDIYTEAFRRMGIKFKVVFLPGNRAAKYSELGITDGEIERVETFGEFHRNLVKVREHSRILVFSAYSFNENIKLDGWDSLIDKDYKIGYKLGTKLIENEILKRVDKSQVSATVNGYSSLEKLNRGRIDIFIDIEGDIDKYTEHPEFNNRRALHKVGVMTEITVHAHLNVKHKELEPELSDILAEMKKEGLFKEYMKKYNENYRW